MDLSGFKKKGNSKEAWLDWLSDDAPSPQAQAELRQRHVQRANTYQPRQFTPQSGAPSVNPSLNHQQPAQAARPAPTQPQAFRSAVPPTAAPLPPQAAAGQGSGVSIQINIPQLRLERLRRLIARIRDAGRRFRGWFALQWVDHKPRVITVSLLAVLVLASLVATPLLHRGAKGGTGDAAAAAPSVKYNKPPFSVVVPGSKPKLATPDGVHAAYDGTKNTYSYSDSIGQNGFIVSEQPIPDKFNTAADAISSIGPQIYGPTAINHTVTTFSGDALVTLSSKGAQTIVFSVHNLLMFIQSSHKFSDTDIQDYINSLQ